MQIDLEVKKNSRCEYKICQRDKKIGNGKNCNFAIYSCANSYKSHDDMKDSRAYVRTYTYKKATYISRKCMHTIAGYLSKKKVFREYDFFAFF